MQSIDLYIRPLSNVKMRKGQFGDKKVVKFCKKIMNGDYIDPLQLIWSLSNEGKIDSHQFKMMIYAAKGCSIVMKNI